MDMGGNFEGEHLGLPMARARGSMSVSVSSVGSELGFEHENGHGNEVGGGRPAQEQVLHSTRASSGVFPEV